MNHLEHAKQYLQQGFSVIPLAPKKKNPIIPSWEEYMRRLPTEEEVTKWWSEHPDANIGIITGSVSNLVIVDVDPRNGGNESAKTLHLPTTYVVKTGGGGWHHYYRPRGKVIAKATGHLAGIDILAEKAYAVAPPSVTDMPYEPAGEIVDIVEAPDWLLDIQPKSAKLWEAGINGAPEGQRNETAASLCGKIFSSLPSSLWENAWASVKDWNGKNIKPLPEKELRDVFESIMKKAQTTQEEGGADNGKPSIAQQIIEMVLSFEPEFMHDDLGTCYVRVPIGNHKETHPIQSAYFKKWVASEYWNRTNKPPKSEQVKQALDVLAGIATFDGKKQMLANRVAESDGAFWYDLGDKDWRVVRITSEGWNVVENPPAIFRRHKHQIPQTTPATGASLSKLLEFVNISDEQQRLLLQVYIVACFVPNIPHPIPVLYGSQGSAKSTFMRVLRKIIDPSSIELLTLPTQSEQLVQQLSHHWAPFYDNVTTLPEWLSDALCRAVTGEGFSKRELYTDDEDMIYRFRCCVGLNGINIAAQKPDLLDRSILFSLQRISPEKRMDEQSFWKKFEEARPLILGAAFDALSKAIVIRQNMKPIPLPRMADFALWGCAVAEALGYAQSDFLKAYQTNINQQNEEAIHEHPVATTICSLMETYPTWTGTSTQLMAELEVIADAEKINKQHKLWPKAPQALSRRLNEAKTNLEAVGISVNMSHGTKRNIIITRTGNTDDTVEGKTDAHDDTDGIPQDLLPVTLERIQQELDPSAKLIPE